MSVAAVAINTNESVNESLLQVSCDVTDDVGTRRYDRVMLNDECCTQPVSKLSDITVCSLTSNSSLVTHYTPYFPVVKNPECDSESTKTQDRQQNLTSSSLGHDQSC